MFKFPISFVIIYRISIYLYYSQSITFMKLFHFLFFFLLILLTQVFFFSPIKYGWGISNIIQILATVLGYNSSYILRHLLVFSIFFGFRFTYSVRLLHYKTSAFESKILLCTYKVISTEPKSYLSLSNNILLPS